MNRFNDDTAAMNDSDDDENVPTTRKDRRPQHYEDIGIDIEQPPLGARSLTAEPARTPALEIELPTRNRSAETHRFVTSFECVPR